MLVRVRRSHRSRHRVHAGNRGRRVDGARIAREGLTGADWPIVGYVDRLGVSPGDTLGVMVGTEQQSYVASVVRLGEARPQPAAVPAAGLYAGRVQPVFPGSYVAVPDSEVFAGLRVLELRMWIYPTLPGAGRIQGLVAKWSGDDGTGWRLYVDEVGALTFEVGTQTAASRYRSSRQVQPRRWCQIICAVSCHSGMLRLAQDGLVDEGGVDCPGVGLPVNRVPLLVGAASWETSARPHATGCFDGKIENPSLSDKDRVLASWDFSIGISSSAIEDTSANRLHGTTVNMPMRGATGHSWCGREQRFADAPKDYGAIHFHSDDLSDAGWDRSLQVEIPADLPSGAYAVRLETAGGSDDVPFFVLPGSRPHAPIAFLASTLTYLAYANDHFWSGTGTAVDGPAIPDPADLFAARHPEVGRGLYDRHVDGSGCCYASRRRPLLNLRPRYRYFRTGMERNFSADLLLLQWLQRKGFTYDVVTDDELHARGVEALAGYNVALTGSHPEYVTGAMLDALGAYLERGGSLMYLGGNGFYWVTSLAGDREEAIEVRRGLAGTRTWSSEPGELYHSSTGELGGLWRHRGRAPNRLVGVGFGAMGDGGSGYRRLAGSFRPEAAFIFEGVGADEVLGEHGAAGDEVDRLDLNLGSPPQTILLASASDLGPAFQAALEDHVIENRDDATNPTRRADMVYFDLPAGGAVFSVGSMNWVLSLGEDDDENSVSRITENVLRRFSGS